jgi:hypothetical protein
VILHTLYVRFFRSFNFDYLRQDKEGVETFPWDAIVGEESFYPFVSLSLESDITTVVGANEAGKSQLITAIQCLLGDRPISPRDFCRYSTFFGVRGTMPRPEFGGRFRTSSLADRAALISVVGEIPDELEDFWLFRQNDSVTVYWRIGGGFHSRPLAEPEVELLRLPVARRIAADVPLPASVNLYDLVSGQPVPDLRSRADWDAIHRQLKTNEPSYAVSAEPISTLLANPLTQAPEQVESARKSLSLVRDLFEKVASVDRRAFSELLTAGGTDDGYSAALAASITEALAVSLNFPQWWTQDENFSLEVHKDGFYLVLTMRDKTGQTYTFDERSGGMKYFLSYFVQYKAYGPIHEDRSEILLMDEPDAFLSTQGQQDLMRIFDKYAHPDSDVTPAAQVLYVTHSPFLIDKNHPERIRVLQKGFGEEGTRVVAKAATDNYEPLRSAFGSFHADTAFIGTCNLLVEGPADLILFSGVSSAMRQDSNFQGANLNLNELTMVPVHGSTQYRYMIHMTRSGLIDRPAVVVLLDSDPAGDAAHTDVTGLENGFGERPILNPDLILTIGSLPFEELGLAVPVVHEPEDLISAELASKIIQKLATDFLSPGEAATVHANIAQSISVRKGKRLFDEAQRAALEASSGNARPFTIGKIEFARALGDIATELPNNLREPLFAAFSILFEEINTRQDIAMREHAQERISQVTRRLVERFRRDHRERAQKRSVAVFLDEVQQHISGSGPDEESIRSTIREIRDRFALSDAPLSYVPNYSELKASLGDLIYKTQREASRPNRVI